MVLQSLDIPTQKLAEVVMDGMSSRTVNTWKTRIDWKGINHRQLKYILRDMDSGDEDECKGDRM